jgi:hypothetical protein
MYHGNHALSHLWTPWIKLIENGFVPQNHIIITNKPNLWNIVQNPKQSSVKLSPTDICREMPSDTWGMLWSSGVLDGFKPHDGCRKCSFLPFWFSVICLLSHTLPCPWCKIIKLDL